MANTPEKAFKEGYGEHAYEHAKPGKFGPKEKWTRDQEAVNAVRKTEYEKRLKTFQKKFELQKVESLSNIGKVHTFEKGDTLYSVLKDFFKMNEHTAFFTMIKMLERGINVDVWEAGDKIQLLATGAIEVTRNGTVTNMEGLLKTLAAGAVPPGTFLPPGSYEQGPRAGAAAEAPRRVPGTSGPGLQLPPKARPKPAAETPPIPSPRRPAVPPPADVRARAEREAAETEAPLKTRKMTLAEKATYDALMKSSLKSRVIKLEDGSLNYRLGFQAFKLQCRPENIVQIKVTGTYKKQSYSEILRITLSPDWTPEKVDEKIQAIIQKHKS